MGKQCIILFTDKLLVKSAPKPTLGCFFFGRRLLTTYRTENADLLQMLFWN